MIEKNFKKITIIMYSNLPIKYYINDIITFKCLIYRILCLHCYYYNNKFILPLRQV